MSGGNISANLCLPSGIKIIFDCPTGNVFIDSDANKLRMFNVGAER